MAKQEKTPISMYGVIADAIQELVMQPYAPLPEQPVSSQNVCKATPPRTI